MNSWYPAIVGFTLVLLLTPSLDIAMGTQAGNVILNPTAPIELKLHQIDSTVLKQYTIKKTSNNNAPYSDLIVVAAERYKVDPALIQAIIFAESGYNPKARSRKGAVGLMQLMPSTAKSLGVKDIYNPKDNIDGGVRYFKKLLERFDGDVKLALAAYNAGSRYVRKYKGIPPFKATKIYIKKVLKYKEKYSVDYAVQGRMA